MRIYSIDLVRSRLLNSKNGSVDTDSEGRSADDKGTSIAEPMKHAATKDVGPDDISEDEVKKERKLRAAIFVGRLPGMHRDKKIIKSSSSKSLYPKSLYPKSWPCSLFKKNFILLLRSPFFLFCSNSIKIRCKYI